MELKTTKRPDDGQAITFENGSLKVPDRPIIPFIEGDGTGPDIWKAAAGFLTAAVEKAYKVKERLAGWKPMLVKNLIKWVWVGCQTKL